MFRLKVEMPRMKFNARGFSEALHRAVQTQMRQAARAFIRAAITKIPVDTGQARGTFLPFGRLLRVAIPIPGATPEKGKSPSTGASASKRLIFQFRSNKTGEVFELDLQLFYFWFNDFFAHNYPNAQLPTPWGSIEAGIEAFVEYIKGIGQERLPHLKDFILFEKGKSRFG